MALATVCVVPLSLVSARTVCNQPVSVREVTTVYALLSLLTFTRFNFDSNFALNSSSFDRKPLQSTMCFPSPTTRAGFLPISLGGPNKNRVYEGWRKKQSEPIFFDSHISKDDRHGVNYNGLWNNYTPTLQFLATVLLSVLATTSFR